MGQGDKSPLKGGAKNREGKPKILSALNALKTSIQKLATFLYYAKRV